MPRTVKEILDQADEFAERFEAHEPDPADVSDAAALAWSSGIPSSCRDRAPVADAVSVARAEGHSWAAIGAMVGTSGEAHASATAAPFPSVDNLPTRSTARLSRRFVVPRADEASCCRRLQVAEPQGGIDALQFGHELNRAREPWSELDRSGRRGIDNDWPLMIHIPS